MSTTYVTTNPAVLDGFQAIFEPSSKYNKHTLQAVIDEEHIDAMSVERERQLEWARSKSKQPNRVVVKYEPWEEVSKGKYKVKFSWDPEMKVPVVDSKGTAVTNFMRLDSGSQVKLVWEQGPYVMPDAIGTRLKIRAIQIIQAQGNGLVDGGGSIDAEAAAAMFGVSDGFTVDDPNVSVEKQELIAQGAEF